MLFNKSLPPMLCGLALLSAANLCAAAEPAASAPHQEYDRKFRSCTKAANEKSLGGDARKAFIAECMKKA